MRPLVLLGWIGCLALSAVRAAESASAVPGIRQPLPPPPKPPPRRPPTDLFRELLAAPPAERQALLSERPRAARELIETKLREFERLSPDERELRLRAAELQFYLSPMLRAPVGDRPRLLGAAPSEVQPFLESRLRTWDAIPESRRQAMLDSETALSQFTRFPASDPSALDQVLRGVPEERRSALEAQWRRWTALTPAERSRQTEDFRRFLELRPAERDKVLRRISAVERRQMEATLEQFRSLPPEQRDRALRGFRRFLDMTPAEREGFLENAAQWERLTPDERDAWRRVVERVRNPVPIPMPPDRTRPPRLAATNAAVP